MAIHRWTTDFVPRQRALFAEVWTTYVSAQLEALNNAIAPRHVGRSDVRKVGAARAAACLAAAWMGDPARLARPVDPEPESSANRIAVSSILFLTSGELSGLPQPLPELWQSLVLGLQPELAEQLRHHPLSGWDRTRHRSRSFGLGPERHSEKHEFAQYAQSSGLAIAATDDPLASDGDGDARPWFPYASVPNWFGWRARMKTEPSAEKRHAVVDAFFHGEYSRLAPPQHSPVDLLGSFPSSRLVDPPDPRLPVEEYVRDCVMADELWHQRFEAGLHGYPEADLVRQRVAAQRYTSPPAYTAVPATAALLTLIEDFALGTDLDDETMTEAFGQARAGLGTSLGRAGRSHEIRTAAAAVLAWGERGFPRSERSALVSLLDQLPAGAHVAVVALCHHAVTAHLPADLEFVG